MIIGYPNQLLPHVIHKMFINFLEMLRKTSHIISVICSVLLNTYYVSIYLDS